MEYSIYWIFREFIYCFKKNYFLINISLNDKKFTYLKFYQETDDVLLIKYNPSKFHSDQSGEIELRFCLDNIKPFNRFINK